MEIRPIRPDEFRAYVTAVENAFGGDIHDDELGREQELFEPDRSLGAYDGADLVATAGAFSFDMSVPGTTAPVAGVTMVGVAPTHRRRGILTALMRRQLDDLRDRAAEGIAALWASEAVIYQRFGYGLGAWQLAGDVPVARAGLTRPVPDGYEVRLVGVDEVAALADPVFEAVRARRPGLHRRSDAWWRHRLFDPERSRGGASALRCAVCTGPDGAEAYALYSPKQDWSDALPRGATLVREIVAATPDAETALWSFLFGIDLTEKVSAWNLPADTPLQHLLLEPRWAQLRKRDNLWVRVVDVPKALAARRYAVPGEVVLEVEDSFCPWNAGRWRLVADDAGVACERTGAEPDVALSASGLGALYLGGSLPSGLALAGRVAEVRAGGLRRADALFPWSPAPWSAQVF